MSGQQFLNTLSLSSKKVLVVGGTSGIGEAIATKFASLGASVTIAGRSEKAATQIISDFNKSDFEKKGSLDFKQVDVSLVSNCKKFSKEVASNSYDYIVLSAGMMRMGGRNETSEGLDDKMALHYYSRFTLIQELAPLLAKKSDGRILSVLAAGQGHLVDENDLDLKNNYGVKQCADSCTLYNDLMVESFSKAYPTVGFTHAFPGFVNTPLANGNKMPWFIKAPLSLITPLFSRTPEQCATYLLSSFLDEEHKTGWHLMGQNGEPVKLSASHTEAVRQRVWDFTVNLIGKFP
ncbi:hypothetical protein BC833DRAFT_622823 [Globomyces pollinis-pini]|nr:hypothetical protein BC833DRAFT_622823 [Globomyces pollinis-pini]KAJ2994143.1 hypothetical protein HDV02_001840 [Globomyces sp. JEL0801]